MRDLAVVLTLHGFRARLNGGREFIRAEIT